MIHVYINTCKEYQYRLLLYNVYHTQYVTFDLIPVNEGICHWKIPLSNEPVEIMIRQTSPKHTSYRFHSIVTFSAIHFLSRYIPILVFPWRPHPLEVGC